MGKTGERMQVCRKGIPLASVQVWKVCRVGTVCRNWNWNASQGGFKVCLQSGKPPPRGWSGGVVGCVSSLEHFPVKESLGESSCLQSQATQSVAMAFASASALASALGETCKTWKPLTWGRGSAVSPFFRQHPESSPEA